MNHLLAVFIGGGLGSICRYTLSNLNVDSSIAYGTLLANFISSLILGYLAAYMIDKDFNPTLGLLLATGFCGGFSTFSTFSLEAFTLLKNGESTLAFLYIVASILIGLLAIFLGFRLEGLSS